MFRGYSHIDTQPDKEELSHCAEQLAQDYLPEGWQRIASSTFTRVAYHPEQQLYYKEFLRRSPVEALKAWVNGSRATRARRNGEMLLLAGIDAPANIHWGKLPGGTEYLFTAAVPGHSLREWLRDVLTDGSPESLQQRRALLAALGTFLGRVHAAGYIHGDLRPGNILAQQVGERFRFTLLDNERNVHKTPPPGRRLLRNLMQLNMLPLSLLGRTDRMRFFRAWRRQMRDLEDIEAKIIAAEAYNWALRRMDAGTAS